MKDNRGMSLVELLLTVAILAIVIVGAATFMMTGSRSFAKGSADSNVQGEAELAVNQIEDLVIDVNGGVDYVTGTNTESLVMYHVEADASGLSVYKERNVTWNKTDNNIYSSEWTVDKDGSGVYARTSQIYADQLLAKNVTDFNVDLSDIVTETDKDGNDIDIVRSVVIKVGCLDGTGKAAYATTPTITLRNRMMLSSNPETIFPNTPAPDDSLLLYISDTGMEAALPIRDRVTTVERGKVYNIFAMVNAGTNVNSLCDFTVEGETSGTPSTITPNGVHIALSVDAAEPNTYLKITASYTTNPSKKVSGWVKVIGGDGLSLKGVKILPKSLLGFTPKYDSALQWSAKPSDADTASLVYTWSVNKPEMVASMASPTREELDLEVKPAKPKNEDEIIKIRITLVVYCGTTNQTVSDWVDFIIPPEGTGGGDSLLERGKLDPNGEGYHNHNWYGFTKPGDLWPVDIIYDYYFCDINTGKRLSEYDGLLDSVVMVPGLTSYYLSFKNNLPPENEYYIKVVLNYEQYEGGDSGPHYLKVSEYDAHKNQHKYTGKNWKYSRVQYIPAVRLYGNDMHLSQSVLDSGFDFTYDIIGYYELAWAATGPYSGNEPASVYEVEDFVCDVPDGYTVTPQIMNGQHTTDTSADGYCSFTVTCEKGPGWLWEHKSEIKLKSMKIKVSLKDHPKIYTYINVTFE